uniref:EamA domain-containing protein n=2 Tax=Emiliania huxleyi TaxID=2903 RepID=A0A6V2PK12_EMIHU
MAVARTCISGSERLSKRALAGGALALLGMVLLTQPAAVFGRAPPSVAGSLLAVGGGLSLGGFNVWSRLLGRATPHGAPLSPATLTAYLMLVFTLAAAAVQCAAAAVGPAAPGWAVFTLQMGGVHTATMVALYCTLVLVFQLGLAAAYGLMPAGRAAVLSLTELGFTWLLGTVALQERTDWASGLGLLAILVGSALSTDGGCSSGSVDTDSLTHESDETVNGQKRGSNASTALL